MSARLSAVVSKATGKDLINFTDEQMKALTTLSGVALAVLATAGIVTLSFLAPNILSASKQIFKIAGHGKRLSKKEKVKRISRAFYYLRSSKLIIMKPEADDFTIELTSLGKERHSELHFESLRIPKPKKWNGKWWLVAADIPTREHRSGADSLRLKLRALGFCSLQRTLWIYPYDPRQEMRLILSRYNISQFVTLMEINRLDREDELKAKQFFNKRSIL